MFSHLHFCTFVNVHIHFSLEWAYLEIHRLQFERPYFPNPESYLSHSMTKATKWHVCPVKTQISLGIHPVWSESSLAAWRKLRSLATHKAHSEDSDQSGQLPRLIWVFPGRTGHFVGFVMQLLILKKFRMENTVNLFREGNLHFME